MLVSREIAEHIAWHFPDGAITLETSLSRTLCSWIFDFYRNSKGESVAMADTMATAIRHRIPELPKEEDRENIQDYLKALNTDWQSLVPKSIGDAKAEAEKHFRKRHLNALADRLKSAMESGRLEDAEQAVAKFARPTGVYKPVNLLDTANADKISNSFEGTSTLFTLPGILGKMIGPIIPGDFIVPIAPKKTGKSWLVDWVSLRAAMSGCRVLVVDCEMTMDQKLRRLWRQIKAMPLTAGEYEVPRFAGSGEILWEKKYREALKYDRDTVLTTINGLRGLSRSGCLDIVCMPTKGAKVADLKAVIANKKRESGQGYNFIVVDSPDYFKPDGKVSNTLDALGEVWQEIRGISQSETEAGNPCAVMGPSHSGRASWDRDAKESDISGDARKLAVATKALILKRTKKEAENGIIRISSDTSRDNATSSQDVVVLQQLDLARFYLDSMWVNDCKAPEVFRPKNKDDDDLP